jgi:hypothetical protein
LFLKIFVAKRLVEIYETAVKRAISSTDRGYDDKVHSVNSTNENLLKIAINRNASAQMIMTIVDAGGVAGDVGRVDTIHNIPAIQAAIISSNDRVKNGMPNFSNELILTMIAARSTLTLSEIKLGHKKPTLKKNNVSQNTLRFMCRLI